MTADEDNRPDIGVTRQTDHRAPVQFIVLTNQAAAVRHRNDLDARQTGPYSPGGGPGQPGYRQDQ